MTAAEMTADESAEFDKQWARDAQGHGTVGGIAIVSHFGNCGATRIDCDGCKPLPATDAAS